MAKQADIRGLSSIWSRLTGSRAGSESSIRSAPSQADQRSTRNKTITASASDPQTRVSEIRRSTSKPVSQSTTVPDDSVAIGGTITTNSFLDPVNKAVLNKWATDYENLGKEIIRVGNLTGVDPLISGEIQNEITADLQKFKKNLGL
jgi:hypothetical protein